MKQLLSGIISTIQTNQALGGTLHGLWGPFWNLAPETVNLGASSSSSSLPSSSSGSYKPAYPRLILSQTESNNLLRKFGGGKYAEPVDIQFKVYNTTLLNTATVADAITAIFDNNRITLTGGDIVNIAFRQKAPYLIQEITYNSDNSEVYSAVINYHYEVQRTN